MYALSSVGSQLPWEHHSCCEPSLFNSLSIYATLPIPSLSLSLFLSPLGPPSPNTPVLIVSLSQIFFLYVSFHLCYLLYFFFNPYMSWLLIYNPLLICLLFICCPLTNLILSGSALLLLLLLVRETSSTISVYSVLFFSPAWLSSSSVISFYPLH